MRDSKAAKVFDRALAEELREARASAAASTAEAAATREEATSFYRQAIENQVELAKRENKKQDKARESHAKTPKAEEVVASSSQPPPPPGGSGAAVLLPINNPIQHSPDVNASGAQVTGPKQAVIPNTSIIPANPAPTGKKRADNKPL